MTDIAAAGRTPYAYIGSFTSQGGDGITTAAVDPRSGALQPRHRTGAVPDPSWLALSSGPRLLYAVSEVEQGRVAALGLADPERPVPVAPPADSGGASPTHLAVDGGWLFAAHYASGTVGALPLRADGLPAGGPPAVHAHHGSGPVPGRQEAPHAHAVVTAPGGNWLLAVDLGTDTVWVYARVPGTGGLRPRRKVRLRPGSGPRHLAFHPDGRTVYLVNELASTLTWCRWEEADGVLDPRGEVPVLPPDAPAAARPDGNFPSGLAVTPDGRHAYVANRGDDSVALLALAPDSGRPELAGTVPCGGAWPRALTLGPGARRLYLANERSGEVSWFDLDPADGTPRPAGSLTAPAAACIVFG